MAHVQVQGQEQVQVQMQVQVQVRMCARGFWVAMSKRCGAARLAGAEQRGAREVDGCGPPVLVQEVRR